MQGSFEIGQCKSEPQNTHIWWTLGNIKPKQKLNPNGFEMTIKCKMNVIILKYN